MMERGVRRKSHAPCEAGEKVAITSKSYLSLSERMEQNGHTYEPIRDTLPEKCYTVLPSTGEIVIIKRNELGYYNPNIPAKDAEEARMFVDDYNKKLGVNRAQEEAMKAGSMFGWTTLVADPSNYNSDGKLIKTK